MGKATGMYQCPSCAQTVIYRSDGTRIRICVCGQVLNRLDSDELVAKPAYTIIEHNDWVQTGTTGVFQDKKFEVLGRFRLWLEESVYNYWTVLFEDGSLAWLSEGYGMYAIIRRVTLDKAVTVWDVDRLARTDSIQVLGEEDWFVQRKDTAWKYEVEGEVWMPECTDQFRIFDLYARGDSHIELIEFLHDWLAPHTVIYVDYKDLQLQNLNENPVRPLEIQCTQCHTPIAVKTFPYAQSCSCVSCGARQIFKHSSGFSGAKKDKENLNQADIPLGATGMLKGIEYEVIGYSLKEEDSAESPQWKEYVLYNRAEGYAFLSEYKGSWIYTRERGNSPVISRENPTSIYYKDIEFELYNRYSIRIVDTAGEFPFNVFDDQTIVSAEFISPPHMWVYEKPREDGIDWFLGEYLSRKELLKAFPCELPPQTEMGVLDPRGSINLPGLIKVTLAAMVFLALVHFAIGLIQTEKQIFSGDLQLKDSAASSIFVSPPFTLNKWRSNLQFTLHAPVDNNWLDMEAALVNTSGGPDYQLEQLVEYYHGYDDGNWNEGSPNETAYLSAIPAGTYFLRIEASRDTTMAGWNDVKDLELTVKNDVPMHRNLLVFLGLLLIWPLGMYIWYQFKERQRWSNSRFSPFKD